MKRGPRKGTVVVHKSDDIDYKNLELLAKCIGPQGQMLSRRRTGAPTDRQRKLKQAIKRARHLALLPYVG